MIREITTHKVNGLNEALAIAAGQAGPGGAPVQYFVSMMRDSGDMYSLQLQFQNGPLQETGPNGISNEALLAIVEDRLMCFQQGAFACVENAKALESVRDALVVLKARTLERTKRGVEGTMQP